MFFPRVLSSAITQLTVVPTRVMRRLPGINVPIEEHALKWKYGHQALIWSNDLKQ